MRHGGQHLNGWQADGAWRELLDSVPWRDEMATCVQDPVFHAEGDVLTHVRMVCEALEADPRVASLPSFDRHALTVSAVLHDIKKPATRITEWSEEDGRVRVGHPNHSIKGARAAHAFLFKNGVDAATRERVFSTIAWHQRVFRVMERDDPRVEVVRYSHLAPFHDLALHGDADNEGRVSPGRDSTKSAIEVARMVADEEGCLHRPYPFESDEARVLFARNPDKGYFYVPQPAKGSRVILLSGLPGSGKSTYAGRRLAGIPQVSLDGIREEMDVAAGKNQGAVVNAAFERAKEYLRRKEPFVWNAVAVTRRIRDQVIDLCLLYDAHVSVHVMDTPWARVLEQNRDRKACVPQGILENMLESWEPVSPLEAHQVWRVSPKHELARAFDYGETDVPALAVP